MFNGQLKDSVLQICMRVTECFAVGGLAMDPAVRRGVLTRYDRVVRKGPRNEFLGRP
jgi:hypothetical protein